MKCLIRASLLTIAAAFFSACNRTAAPSNSGSPAGAIRVSGAWALYPMMVAWAEAYQKLYPAVRIDISAGGAGKGLADALAGLADLGMVSREIAPEETARGACAVAVAKDAVMCIISAANPHADALVRRGITKESCVGIWMTGTLKAWSNLVGGAAPEAINVYTRSDAAGAPETWAKYLGGTQENLKGTGVYGDPGLAEAVKQDRCGIGYANLNYAYDMTTGRPVNGVRVVPLDANGNGIADPAEDISTKAKAVAAIAAHAYPSPPARDLYLVTKQRFSGVTAAFVRWILTDGQAMTGTAGYISPTPGQLAAAVALVSAAR